MSASELLEQAKALPLQERVELAQSLWEDIMEGFEPGLTPDEAREIDRRLSEHQANPEDVISWEEVKAKLDAKLGT